MMRRDATILLISILVLPVHSHSCEYQDDNDSSADRELREVSLPNIKGCEKMQACLDQFYDGVEKAGVQSPLPDYGAYASKMKSRFEHADGIEDLCSLQASLDTCINRQIDEKCPLNAASFRTMYYMNYEQAYYYSTDFNLRQTQCMHKEGMVQIGCLTDAESLLKECEPNFPQHNLTLGTSCTDLRLSLNCINFVVQQFCPEEAQEIYCETTSIIFKQAALGFCDGWMPECEPKHKKSTKGPKPSKSPKPPKSPKPTKAPKPTKGPKHLKNPKPCKSPKPTKAPKHTTGPQSTLTTYLYSRRTRQSTNALPFSSSEPTLSTIDILTSATTSMANNSTSTASTALPDLTTSLASNTFSIMTAFIVALRLNNV